MCAEKQQCHQNGHAEYSLASDAFQEALGALHNAANYQTGSSDCPGDRCSQGTDRVGAYQMPDSFPNTRYGTGWYVREEVIGGISVRSGQLHYCKKERTLASMWDLRMGEWSAGMPIYGVLIYRMHLRGL